MNVTAVGGLTKTADDSFTRPNNTTQYAANDAVSDSDSAPSVLEFDVARGDGGSGVILQAICVDSANQATKPDLELWLFDTAPTGKEDNAAFDPSDAETRNLVAIIPFGNADFLGGIATSGADGNCVNDVQGLAIPFNCKGNDKKLYGLVVVRNAYTPVAQEVFKFRLKVAQDPA